MSFVLAKTHRLYEPLEDDDIRMMYLLPGAPDSIVKCHMSNGRLNPIRNFAKFRAVSYTWGDENDTVPIIVDGHEFLARRNLHDLLLILRVNLTTVQPFWIDAICLNQADDEEKSKQVPRMSDIYSLAEDVIFWLGRNPPDEDKAIGRAFEAATELHELSQADDVRDFNTWYQSLQASRPDLYQRLNETRSAWELIDKRPWFTRAWIVQEISLAKSNAVIYAGQHSISMRAFENFLRTFQLSSVYSLAVPRIITMMGTRLWYHTSDGWEGKSDYGVSWRESNQWATFSNLMVQLLMRTSGVHCFMPQDRLYALFGMVRKMLKDDIVKDLYPDYSLPWAKVYQTYAMHLIDSTADLRLLAFKRSGLPAGTPSWVPDFRYFGLSHSVPKAKPKGLLGFSADGKVLEDVQGVRLGTCVGFVPPWPENEESYFENIILRILDPRAKILGLKRQESFEEFHHSVSRCVVLSFTFDERFEDEDRLDDDAGKTMADTTAQPISTTQFKTLKKWGKILLSDGTIGEFIRQDTVVEDGDVVVAFRGATFPMVLRLKRDNYYELVGACYLASPNQLTEGFFADKSMERFNLV